MTDARELITGQGGMDIALQINTMDELERLCTKLATSSIVPKAFATKPGDIFVAILHGKELGIPPLQALSSICVINGIPSLYGDMALSLVRSSGKLADFDEFFEGEGDNYTAVCVSRRKDSTRDRRTIFSIGDAKRASLWGKSGPWTQYPERMLMWRARGFNLRDNFGDVLKGLVLAEEAQDIYMERVGDHAYAPASATEEAKAEPQPASKSGLIAKMKTPKAAETFKARPAATKSEQSEPPTKAEPLPSDGAKVASKKAEVVTPEPSGHQLGTVTMVRYTGKDGSPYANSEGMPFVVFTMENNGKSLEVCYFGKPSVLGVKTMDDLLGHDLRFLVKSTTGLGGKLTHTIFDVIPDDVFEAALAERAAKESKEE